MTMSRWAVVRNLLIETAGERGEIRWLRDTKKERLKRVRGRAEKSTPPKLSPP